MQPLQLTLKGFRGIRDGLGRDEITLDLERLADGAQLIAIAGANGRGKTTLIENLVPHLNLPSRAAAAGPGGFSYYDHVYLAESIKDLTWAHEGRSYRSQVVIRLGSRRRTEAFLHVLDDAGGWRPVRLDDGTLSDGKVDTYNRCVEAICGNADTFYTSVFASQGKRQLSSYRNAEIKSLLADLLGQDEIRALGTKALETARLLKAGLLVIRQELAVIGEDRDRLTVEQRRLADIGERLVQAATTREQAQHRLDAAQLVHAQRAAEREQSRASDARRAQLAAERQAAVVAGEQQRAALQAQDRGEVQRLERLDQRIAARVRQEHGRRQALMQTRQQCHAVLRDAPAVEHAARRVGLAERVLVVRAERVLASRRRAQQWTQADHARRMLVSELEGVEREAGRAALKAEELARRAGLANEVPCVGTGLQGRCKLLGDAQQARGMIPSAQGQIARLAQEASRLRQALTSAQRQCTDLADAAQRLSRDQRHEARSRDRVSRYAVLAARADECARARQALVEVDRERAGLPVDGMAGTTAYSTEEVSERQTIAAARQGVAQQLRQLAARQEAGMTRLDAALAALPAPWDEQRMNSAARTASDARAALGMAERLHLQTLQEAQASESLSRQVALLAERHARADARRLRVEGELGAWNLFALCMSHDGLIALAIDDAGPALSGLANELLLACDGPRFTVAIHTLLTTGKGEQKEGFDISVHDAETGERKSAALMSGGERSWIESVMTRAIALYLAQHSGRRYGTLFSDEADGPLDAQRKRMFMAMKRTVLRLGGYEREFFISQTPELTAMADAVIDLDAWCTQPAGCAPA